MAPKSVASSRSSPAALSTPSGSDDVYSGNLDEDWEVYGDDGSHLMSGRWKKIRSKFDRYCYLLLEQNELDGLSSLNSLLDWFIVGACSGDPLFATPSGDKATPVVTMLHNCIASLKQHLLGRE